MQEYSEKMGNFVEKLWNNPNLNYYSLTRKENQILSFLKENKFHLEQAFKQDMYFPTLSWDESIRLFLTVLTDIIIQDATPRLTRILEELPISKISDYYHSVGNIDKQKIQDFIVSSLKQKPMRDAFFSSMDTVLGGFFKRYVPIILERRKGIYIEIIRRDKISMDPELIPAFLSLASLFRPLYIYPFPDSGRGNLGVLSKTVRNYQSLQKIMPRLDLELQEIFGQLPQEIYKIGIESNLNAVENPETSGSSRLISILVSRAMDYEPGQKADKGAETPDKSWFHIHRRTSKYYGHDAHFLEELYRIAGEEGW